jgi:hypothetical protein
MKVLKGIIFCFASVGVFLVAGALTCAVRAKYRTVPELKSRVAYSCAGLVADYSFLQYNQAGGEQGKSALQENLEVLHKIQLEKIRYSPNKLHSDYGLTYLRLYRLELAEHEPTEAAAYMTSALREFASVPWKGDLSAEGLANAIATREDSENKNYNNVERTPVAADGGRESLGSTR